MVGLVWLYVEKWIDDDGGGDDDDDVGDDDDDDVDRHMQSPSFFSFFWNMYTYMNPLATQKHQISMMI